ncbi:restriction endonuclease subunit S [Halorhodospira sp. 9621]|uniref:restriction endonuclease subunit S n=1 Tax=Halorhodospira sp. 9621 TaxID=2899135 RepID=UPI001EE81717|nr:restriction endonuclease subunit S [Halorhodospira sp. 9621]MCG5534207.1 restriction endonuclease subunit S [Halorhodospira sp. 9621]
MSYPAYPEYKDSAVEQVGSVPSHWTLCKIKHMLSFLGSGGTPDTEDDKCWADNGNGYPWVAISDMSERSYVDETFSRITEHGLKSKNLELWPWGTLVFSMYASLGHVAELRCCAAINQALLALKPEKNVCQRYLKYWFEFIKPTLIESARSNTQNNLNAYLVRNISCLRPPYHEQYKVAQFLDHETARIDALIEEQQRLIELLKEKRQAVISHAVTKGLDPDVPMKDSGVEWLGEVPAEWVVSKLGYYFAEPPCYGVLVPDFDPDGVPMLRITDMENEYIDGTGLTTISPGLSRQYSRTIVQVGDVVLSLVGTIGKAIEVSQRLEGVNLSRAIARLQLKPDVLPRYVCWIFQSGAFSHFTDLVCRGTAQRVLNVSSLVSFRFTFPSYNEQVAISAFLDLETARIDALMEEAELVISLLQERRSALISAAVTGKIDVRDWTPPASSTEPEHEGEGAVT